MNTLLIIALLLIIVVGTVYATSESVAYTYRKLQGPRLVTCPATGGHVEVELDAAHAALTSLWGGGKLRVTRCARWQEQQNLGCPQGCLCGIDAQSAAEHGLLIRPLRAAQL